MIATSIPNLGATAGMIIIRMMQSNAGKNFMMGIVIKRLNKFYRKIPKKMRRILKDPEKLEKMINKYLKYGGIISKKLLGDTGISDTIINSTKLIAYMLHKMLAITFALLYVFKKCPVK